MNASHSTIPPMPDLDCPSWCERDHAADWAQHVAVGLDTRRIPATGGGFLSDEHRMPLEQWCTLPYFSSTHTARLAEIPAAGPEDPFTIELDREGGEDALYVAGEGPLDAASARRFAAELLNAADRLDRIAQ